MTGSDLINDPMAIVRTQTKLDQECTCGHKDAYHLSPKPYFPLTWCRYNITLDCDCQMFKVRFTALGQLPLAIEKIAKYRTIDIQLSIGDAVTVAYDGVVRRAVNNSNIVGYVVDFHHDDNTVSIRSGEHLLEASVVR